jgi:hypothetical protein
MASCGLVLHYHILIVGLNMLTSLPRKFKMACIISYTVHCSLLFQVFLLSLLLSLFISPWVGTQACVSASGFLNLTKLTREQETELRNHRLPLGRTFDLVC